MDDKRIITVWAKVGRCTEKVRLEVPTGFTQEQMEELVAETIHNSLVESGWYDGEPEDMIHG